MDNIFGFAFLIILVSTFFWVFAQDCRTYGQSCSDDYSCCGGCCLVGICKDTYLDCRTLPVEDPCTNRYCPEDQVCFTHQPPGCRGCGPLVECVTVSMIPDHLKRNRTLTHYHVLSSSNSLILSYSTLTSYMIILGFIPLLIYL